jgi:hypothetical protein
MAEEALERSGLTRAFPSLGNDPTSFGVAVDPRVWERALSLPAKVLPLTEMVGTTNCWPSINHCEINARLQRPYSPQTFRNVSVVGTRVLSQFSIIHARCSARCLTVASVSTTPEKATDEAAGDAVENEVTEPDDRPTPEDVDIEDNSESDKEEEVSEQEVEEEYQTQ